MYGDKALWPLGSGNLPITWSQTSLFSNYISWHLKNHPKGQYYPSLTLTLFLCNYTTQLVFHFLWSGINLSLEQKDCGWFLIALFVYINITMSLVPTSPCFLIAKYTQDGVLSVREHYVLVFLTKLILRPFHSPKESSSCGQFYGSSTSKHVNTWGLATSKLTGKTVALFCSDSYS